MDNRSYLTARRFAVFFLFCFYEFEPGSFVAVVDYLSLHLCFADGFTESIGRVCITMIIDRSAIDEIGFAIETNSQVASFSFQAKLALATFFVGSSLSCFVSDFWEQAVAKKRQLKPKNSIFISGI